MGYCRVSDKDQNPERQIVKMRELGIEERFIIVEKLSGKNFDRPKYQSLKLMLREGDLLYIDALDRLGRTYDGIITEWREITRVINADIVVLDYESLFDSRKFKQMGDIGKLMEDQFLSLLSYVAEQERKKIRQRQREGIDLALAKKLPYGRPKKEITDVVRSAYLSWKKGEITAVEAMRKSGLSKTTFYRLAKKLENSLKEQ